MVIMVINEYWWILMNIDDDDDDEWMKHGAIPKCLGVDYPPVNALQIKTSQKLGMIEGQSVTVRHGH